MSEKVLYFGYGANRDPRMISAITGRPIAELTGRSAILEGYNLAVQRLDQVPDRALDSAPAPLSPRQMLADWGEDFRSYVIHPEENGRVSGTVWELSTEERELVRDWELVDFGWYKDCEGQALTKDGQEISIVSEMLGDGQQIDHEVNGLQYETWLQDPIQFEIIAERARREYYQRLKQDGPGADQKNA